MLANKEINEVQLKQKTTLLLVDDDPLISEGLGFLLSQDYDVVIAETREKANTLLAQMDSVPNMALIDLGLPPFPHRPDEGFALIRELLSRDENIKILVLSGQDEDANIQRALTIGAVDFIAKPVEPTLLLSRLNQHQRLYEIEQKKRIQPNDEFIGDCASIEAIRKQILQFAGSPFPTLITGESGTGKEIIAKALHNASERKAEPYMVINCASIAPDLLEAQLFGHRKGAFTGAEKDHKGFFIEVGEGTLFLDEVGELPISLQSKLLRVLENGEFYRVGETQQQIAKARIIAATNKNIVEEVANGDFRADLYHRLSILNIHMPPLCERGDDKLLLLDHFHAVYSETVPPFDLDEEARELWVEYDFPGNVRELRNIVIRLGTKYPGETVNKQQLEAELETRLSANNLLERTQYFSDETIAQQIQAGNFKLDDILGEVESRCIRIALELYDNNISKAANALHINRTTLYSRVNKVGK